MKVAKTADRSTSCCTTKKKSARGECRERERDPSPLSLRQRAFSSRADRRESGRLRSRSLLFVCVCFFLQVDVDWD